MWYNQKFTYRHNTNSTYFSDVIIFGWYRESEKSAVQQCAEKKTWGREEGDCECDDIFQRRKEMCQRKAASGKGGKGGGCDYLPCLCCLVNPCLCLLMNMMMMMVRSMVLLLLMAVMVLLIMRRWQRSLEHRQHKFISSPLWSPNYFFCIWKTNFWWEVW